MASYNINTFENGDLIINQIDPEFPCGELEGITKEDVEDDWIENNFSGVTKEELEGTGIKVDFVPGESEYTINGEVVTEEEYNEYVENNKPHIVEGDSNKVVLTQTDYSSGYRVSDTVGGIFLNPGHLEITIPQELVEVLLSNNIKSIEEAADKINSWIGSDVFNTAMGLKQGTDKEEIKNFSDEDESERAKTIKNLTKIIKLAVKIAKTGALPEVTVAKVFKKILSKIASIILSATFDGDLNLFQYDEGTNTLKWNVWLKNSDGGTVEYDGEKKINYEEPDKLYNRIAMYLETAKIDMNRTLNKLIQRREVIIKEVKEEINTEMEEASKDSKLKELAYIYHIDFWDYHYEFKVWETVLSQPYTAKGAPDSNSDGLTIELSIDEYGKPWFSVYKNTMALEEGNTDENTVIEDDKYTPGKPYNKILVLRTTEKNYVFDYESFSNNLVNSYYEYYRNQDNNIDFKNNFINQITEDDIVHTGEVDLWHGLEFFDRDEKVFGYGEYSMNVNSEGIEESHKNKTNFISIERIKLAQQMMNQLYSDIMVILEEYSTLGDDFKELDSKISGQIKSAWE